MQTPETNAQKPMGEMVMYFPTKCKQACQPLGPGGDIKTTSLPGSLIFLPEFADLQNA